MSVNWSKDIDQALVEAKEKNRPILLDWLLKESHKEVA